MGLPTFHAEAGGSCVSAARSGKPTAANTRGMAVNSVRDLCQAKNLVAFFIFRSLLHHMRRDRQGSIVDHSWGDRNGPCIFCHPERS
jgi:hypothetical protein